MRIWILVFLLCINNILAFAEEETFVYNDHGKRDPFWPLVMPSGAMVNYDNDIQISDMVLEGIILNNNTGNLAIINGIIVKIEDKIGVYMIGEISQDKVILFKDDESYVLKLKKEELK